MIFSGRLVLFCAAGAPEEVPARLACVNGIDVLRAGLVASVRLEDNRLVDNVPIVPNRAAAEPLLASARPVAYLLS